MQEPFIQQNDWYNIPDSDKTEILHSQRMRRLKNVKNGTIGDGYVIHAIHKTVSVSTGSKVYCYGQGKFFFLPQTIGLTSPANKIYL